MGDAQAVASNVAMAIAAAFDWTSTPDARKSAVSYLDSIKTGDVRVLASASFLLVKKDWSSEIRLHAIKLLQHLVRLRWGELSPSEHRDFANAVVEMMTEIAYSCEQWALKSQISALVAEIVRREGLTLWQELLPSLVSFSSKGPIQAELVSLTLRWLPEDITVHNEDLEGDRRRLLLRGLTESLPDIFPLLYSLLDRHFSDAMHEAEKKQYDIAKQHAATVTATLSAVAAYAEWAPLPDLAKFGIIYGSGVLLSSPDFRLHASEFFKLVSSRKQPVDADAEFDSAMGNVFHIIMSVSRDFLYKSTTDGGQMDESDFEFAEYICEIMVYLGSSNLQCISGDSTVLSLYLEQMQGFFLHYKFALHFQSLLFWLYLMRDLLSKSKAPVDLSRDSTAGSIPASSSGQIPKEKKTILDCINDDICGKILETSFQRLLKKEKVSSGTMASLGNFELWSDDFEGRGDFGQYRHRMLELIKLVATYKPLTSGRKVAERVHSIINNPIQDIALMESMHLALEYVVISIFEGLEVISGDSEVQCSLCAIFEGLLQQVLSLKLTDPVLVELLGRYLDAFGPFLKCFPNAIGSVINKLFELLMSLPITVKDPSTSSARHARLHICSSFVRIAKAVDRSILPHMKAIADTMAYLQREGRILRGEHNILGEAFLVMASSAGLQQQQEVLAWLLDPLIQQWIQTEWQNKYLSEPAGLVHLCSETSFMWSIFHTVTFFEKALKRSGYRKSNVNLQNSPSGNVAPVHPMASHLSWMLPPLLKVFRRVLSKLLRVIHSLLSGPVFCMLPGEIKAAMTMSYAEKTTLLGEGISKSVKGTPSFMDGSQTDLSKQGSLEPNEIDVRNWLKGVRDSGYNVLGLSMTIGDTFFKCLDAHSVAVSLMENIQSMEFRHVRQLVHLVVVPLVKHCPLGSWGVWLENILQPLLIHSQQALSISWSSLLHEGRAKVPDTTGMVDSSDLKVEVMEEKLLRDLTREICALLSVMASPSLNTGLPSLEQSGQASRVDVSSLKEVGTFAETSMVSFLIKQKGLAVPALQMSLEAFTWTDGEAMTKVCAFCATVTQVAIFTNNVELQQYVSRDLFSAIIHGLTQESNAVISADLVSLCREIYVYLCDRDPAPQQVLMSLPHITPHDLIAFKEALTKTSSPKEQKLLMKSLLLLAAGNNLKALAAQKSVNVITNMSARPRSSVSAPSSRVEEDDTVGLASIL